MPYSHWQDPPTVRAIPPPKAPTQHWSTPLPTPPIPAVPPALAAQSWNPEAIAAVCVAGLGLLLETVPLLRAMFGLAAVVLGVIADRKSRIHDAPLRQLGVLGALIGFLEILVLIAR